jgi:hypothetical protein
MFVFSPRQSDTFQHLAQNAPQHHRKLMSVSFGAGVASGAQPHRIPVWFDRVLGFKELPYAATAAQLQEMASRRADAASGREVLCFTRADGVALQAGAFDVASVGELRVIARAAADRLFVGADGDSAPVPATVRNMTGEAKRLHTGRPGAVFQAASQFNCLEMTGPGVTPERGIACYQYDATQGPACAIACGAGTAQRNYCAFSEPSGVRRWAAGQTAARQINTVDDCEAWLATQGVPAPWTLRNGYMDSTPTALAAVTAALATAEAQEEFIRRLKIGVQYDTQVTNDAATFAPVELNQIVTQTYNSACSIGYSNCSGGSWEALAVAVLAATYEATFLVAVANNADRRRLGRAPQPVYLTLVGGGVFRNEPEWILCAIQRAAAATASYGVALEAFVVHYGEVGELFADAFGR